MQGMNVSVAYDYDGPYYTLEEARAIIREEKREAARRKAEERVYKRQEMLYYFKQKCIGLALTGLGVLCPFLMDGDATVSLVIVPLGLSVLFSKEKMCIFSEEDLDE